VWIVAIPVNFEESVKEVRRLRHCGFASRPSKQKRINTRAIVTFILIYAFELSLYLYAMVITKEYENRDTKPSFDWTDDGFGRSACVYILMLVGFNLMYDYLYRLVGRSTRVAGKWFGSAQ
jgi:hypothetical protein